MKSPWAEHRRVWLWGPGRQCSFHLLSLRIPALRLQSPRDKSGYPAQRPYRELRRRGTGTGGGGGRKERCWRNPQLVQHPAVWISPEQALNMSRKLPRWPQSDLSSSNSMKNLKWELLRWAQLAPWFISKINDCYCFKLLFWSAFYAAIDV